MKKGLTRRNMLKTSTAAIGAVAGAGLLKGFPAIHAADAPVIRYLGTAVNMGDAVPVSYTHLTLPTIYSV